MSVNSAFTFNLDQVIQKGLVTVGKYDGTRPSLTCATSSGKILIHNPHQVDKSEEQIKYLSINRNVTALTAGNLTEEGSFNDPADDDIGMPRSNQTEDPSSKPDDSSEEEQSNAKRRSPDADVLLIGTETNLLSYDVDKNADIFYREVQDGLNTMLPNVRMTSGYDGKLLLVGGNCSIQGYDHSGEEQYWTTTGGNVLSLIAQDVDEDGKDEIIAGSDDYSIYIFKDDAAESEITETDHVLDLCSLGNTKYGYALGNGTIGVYDNDKRVWRSKTKDTVNCIHGFDINADGVPEIVTGYQNGSIEVRRRENGEPIYKDQFNHSISSILQADYKMDNKEELIVCSYNGEVRGYLPTEIHSQEEQLDQLSKADEQTIQALTDHKQALEYELQNYEQNIKRIKSGNLDSALINPDTSVDCKLKPNKTGKCVDVVFDASNDTVIKAAVIRAEHLFESESRMVYASEPSNSISVGLKPKRDQTIDMKIQVLVGHELATQFHVFELNYTLPKFSMYLPVIDFTIPPKGSVSFTLKERPKRLVMWLNTSFNIVFNYNPDEGDSVVDVKFESVRNGQPIQIYMKDGKVDFCVDDMEIAGELIHDLSQFMKLTELETVANFPQEFEKFEHTLNQVDEYNKTRLQMTAEMADASGTVKAMVIRAEDARLLEDMPSMRTSYKELFDMNNQLIGEYIKRENNHNRLLGALKEVNLMIQKAARLRVGNAKTKVVAESREAVKKNNIHSLFKIISRGTAQI